MDRETSVCLDALVMKCSGQMSQRKIAEMLGISKSLVNRRALQLKAGATPSYSMSTMARETRECAPQSRPVDQLAILRETRDLLMESMHEATGTARANVARELRETIAEIADLEEDAAEDDDPLAGILSARVL